MPLSLEELAVKNQTLLKFLADYMRAKRKELGFNQFDAAKAIGIDMRHYQTIECCKANVRSSTLVKILSFYKAGLAITPEPMVPEAPNEHHD